MYRGKTDAIFPEAKEGEHTHAFRLSGGFCFKTDLQETIIKGFDSVCVPLD